MPSHNITFSGPSPTIWSMWTEPFSWEQSGVRYFNEHAIIFTILACMYVPSMIGLKAFMKNRAPFNIKYFLFVWNILLSFFSLWGSIVVWPPMIDIHYRLGSWGAICKSDCYNSHEEAARWVLFFNLSKLPEWIDTYTLIVKKREVIFLHWYHHIATFLFCWFSTTTAYDVHCGGFHFATMNLLVHAWMYFYFALTSIGYRPKWDRYLTAAQILQMVAGIAIILTSLTCPKFRWDDYWTVAHTFCGLFMYVSYGVLFAKLFYDKYHAPKAAPRKEATTPGAPGKAKTN